MTPRRQRMLVVIAIVAGTAIGVAFALHAFRGQLLYYYTPTQTYAKHVDAGRHFRLGGLVKKGSVHRIPGTLKVDFVITDNRKSIPVHFKGVLPDLFRAGQGVIASGYLSKKGIFIANDVLAKHDSKYMPIKVYDKKHHAHYTRPGAMNEGGVGNGA